MDITMKLEGAKCKVDDYSTLADFIQLAHTSETVSAEEARWHIACLQIEIVDLKATIERYEKELYPFLASLGLYNSNE